MNVNLYWSNDDHNNYDEEQLKAVLFQYGELRNAPAMARVIVEERKNAEIKTSEQLKAVLKQFFAYHSDEF
mgnify:CR=1 FL=1